jgi:hypothetical protein
MELMELMIFFSGYPFIYLLVHLVSETKFVKWFPGKNITSLLPFTYAMVGLLYLGLQIKNLYPFSSFEKLTFYNPIFYLKIWAISSLLFFIPVLNKKTILTLLHSFVFFFFIVWQILQQVFGTTEQSMIKNAMNVYSISLLVHVAAFALTVLIHYLLSAFKKKPQ